MSPPYPIKKILLDRGAPPILSPVTDVSRPDSLLYEDAGGYRRLFSGLVLRRSVQRVERRGLINRFLQGSSLAKIDADVARGVDISVVLYPVGLQIEAMGMVFDRVGRIFEVTSREDGRLELRYQGGRCRSVNDWRAAVGMRPIHEEDVVRLFYNTARKRAASRVLVAGTVGFGLWDALWMSFDIDRALDLVSRDPDFVKGVFRHWKDLHLSLVRAMLDAGVKLIFLREHQHGFPPGRHVAELIDPLVGEHLLEITKAVRSRGGCAFLDCNADEMLETDYPVKWGFDGIGPLRFRDPEDLMAAARSVNDRLFVVGSLGVAPSDAATFPDGSPLRRIILAQRSLDHDRTRSVAPREPRGTLWTFPLGCRILTSRMEGTA